ncbi:MAG: bifunctional glutamate N-acetyltransferase/amino-acid acetyltransferase ArgJ [bacterium]|nr:bifunctional glutamate N-acetyltransferase/amino-acid acetyltransferase ArgJ [bacterium]
MIELTKIDGGVCASLGFYANGVHCGMYPDPERKDLALIMSDSVASAAGVYTRNLVKGAPIQVTQSHIKDGYASAIICNSGNANTCNVDGPADAEKMAMMVGVELKFHSYDVLVASTGVIGVPLELDPIKKAIPELVQGLEATSEGATRAAEAIMTTDTVCKQVAFSFEIDGRTCHIGGMSKGSGMVHPNMATMLAFLTTDVGIMPNLLQEALSADVEDSFNMISVDGDTSTNDMVLLLANGQSGVMIAEHGEAYDAFCEALAATTQTLAKIMAADGEGATKLITCSVAHAKTKEDARTVAKSVISSSLVKSAMFGEDPNWGRILCAIGYSGADLQVNKIGCVLKSCVGEVEVCLGGAGMNYSEEFAKSILGEDSIEICIDLNDGEFDATAWGCDLTYEYVKINGEYRS